MLSIDDPEKRTTPNLKHSNEIFHFCVDCIIIISHYSFHKTINTHCTSVLAGNILIFCACQQVVRYTAVRSVPRGHFAVGAGDARPGHGVPRAVFQLHRVHGGADQGRSVRHARRSGVLPAPLPAVRAVVRVAAGPATATVAAAEDHHAAVDDARPIAVPVVPGARVARARRRRVLQRRRRGDRWRRWRARRPRAHPTPAKGPSQEAQTQRLGCHDRQHG